MADKKKLLRASELAKAVGAKNNVISQASARGTLEFVIENGRKLYDYNSNKNRDWIQGYCDKTGNEFILARAYDVDITTRRGNTHKKKVANPPPHSSLPIPKNETSAPLNNQGKDDGDEDKLTPRDEKTKLECEKLRTSIKKEQIQIEKISGNLVPAEETAHVLNYVVSNYTAMGAAHFENSLGRIIKEYGGTIDDYKRELEHFKVELVGFAANAIKEIEEGVKGVVESYQEVRGRGERK